MSKSLLALTAVAVVGLIALPAAAEPLHHHHFAPPVSHHRHHHFVPVVHHHRHHHPR